VRIRVFGIFLSLSFVLNVHAQTDKTLWEQTLKQYNESRRIYIKSGTFEFVNSLPNLNIGDKLYLSDSLKEPVVLPKFKLLKDGITTKLDGGLNITIKFKDNLHESILVNNKEVNNVLAKSLEQIHKEILAIINVKTSYNFNLVFISSAHAEASAVLIVIAGLIGGFLGKFVSQLFSSNKVAQHQQPTKITVHDVNRPALNASIFSPSQDNPTNLDTSKNKDNVTAPDSSASQVAQKDEAPKVPIKANSNLKSDAELENKFNELNLQNLSIQGSHEDRLGLSSTNDDKCLEFINKSNEILNGNSKKNGDDFNARCKSVEELWMQNYNKDLSSNVLAFCFVRLKASRNSAELASRGSIKNLKDYLNFYKNNKSPENSVLDLSRMDSEWKYIPFRKLDDKELRTSYLLSLEIMPKFKDQFLRHMCLDMVGLLDPSTSPTLQNLDDDLEYNHSLQCDDNTKSFSYSKKCRVGDKVCKIDPKEEFKTFDKSRISTYLVNMYKALYFGTPKIFSNVATDQKSKYDALKGAAKEAGPESALNLIFYSKCNIFNEENCMALKNRNFDPNGYFAGFGSPPKTFVILPVDPEHRFNEFIQILINDNCPENEAKGTKEHD
jgi:hypothetical protein